jgi:hypothetical protein
MVTTVTSPVRLSPHGKIYFLQATHRYPVKEVKMNYKTLLLIFLVLIMTACGTTRQSVGPVPPQSTATEETSMQDMEADQPPQQPTETYYDFDDVPVPTQMELQPKQSIIFETPGIKSGVIVFTGRVEPLSLFNYFLVSLKNEGWHLRSYFKYQRYIMVFEKPTKDCIIRIIEDGRTTELQIWIIPKLKDTIDYFKDTPPDAPEQPISQ